MEIRNQLLLLEDRSSTVMLLLRLQSSRVVCAVHALTRPECRPRDTACRTAVTIVEVSSYYSYSYMPVQYSYYTRRQSTTVQDIVAGEVCSITASSGERVEKREDGL